MIGRLKGLYDGQSHDFAIIDCNGVGYRVFASSRTLAQLTAIGQSVSLEIETHVREDHIHLFGFLSELERDLFRLLLGVQGVGAKVALAILSTFPPDQLVMAIGAGDQNAIKQVKGVGPKAVQRIITELKDKIGKFAGIPLSTSAPSSAGTGTETGAEARGSTSLPPIRSRIIGDVTSALMNLGYQQTQAFEAANKAVIELDENDDPTIEAAIVLALKKLSMS